MPAPLIGLTTRNITSPTSDFPMIASPKSYTEILIKLGAIPLLIPVNLDQNLNAGLLSRLDGIIFTGGGDIEPARFGGESHDRVHGLDLERDHSEIELLHAVRQTETPLMGICRGLQLINIALGGSLYTHITDQLPDALAHDCFPTHPPDYLAHPVEIKSGSRLAQVLGTTKINVNSLHHQGIKDLAPEAIPLAWAADGLIEAIQVPDNPFGLAVQWHPEWLPDDSASQAFFAEFLKTTLTHQGSRQAFRSRSQAAA